jgi:hypothetical protein
LLCALAPFACSKEKAPPAIVEESDAATANDAGAAFTFQPLGCGDAGTQSTIAVSGTKVGVASLAQTASTQTCTISPLGPVMTSQVQLWNICYAESKGDGTYSSKVVGTPQPYVGPTGVGLAFDPAGNPAIAFTGVGSTPAAERCGANDLFLATSTGGTFGAPVQISHGSQSGGLVAAQAGNCQEGVCNSGDVTGWWPTLGFDPQGAPTMAYRDVHFGFAADDYAMSDVELAQGASGSDQVLTVDVSRGGGTYNRLAFTPAGLPAILQYDATGGAPGVYIDRALTSGGFAAQQADGGWTSSRVSSGPIGEQLGFAISSQGMFAAAYYDQTQSALVYTTSTDGTTWSAPTPVDQNGSTGLYPSLAFDPSDNPAIAYYRCSATAGTTACDVATDGLYLARLVGGTWTPQVVHADPATNDGLYPALAFVSGAPVIAFQIKTTDAIAMTTSSAWWIAESQ